MRYRFSWWDLVLGAALVANLLVAGWMVKNLEGPVPLHWGVDGAPDRMGEPTPVGLLMLPLPAAVTYVSLRLVDLIKAAHRPAGYGFITRLGGGIALFILLIDGLIKTAQLHPSLRVPVLPVTGLLMAYIGWQLRLAPPEAPVNNPGLVPDTPAARKALLTAMGNSLIVTGFLTGLLGFLPGDWAMLALAPLFFGPMAGLVAGVYRANAIR